MAVVINPTTATFSAPTTFEDGSAIPAGTITRYQYGFGQVSGTYTLVVDDADLTPTNGKQTGNLPASLSIGNWFAAARSVTKDGATSKWGNEVAFSIAAKAPSAIADFSLA